MISRCFKNKFLEDKNHLLGLFGHYNCWNLGVISDALPDTSSLLKFSWPRRLEFNIKLKHLGFATHIKPKNL